MKLGHAALGRTAVLAALAGTLALAGAFALTSCSSSPAETENAPMNANTDEAAGAGAYAKIDADEGRALLDEGGVTLIDVRTPQEYADGHIPGALNIPVESIGQDRPTELADANTDAQIIVYCRTGVRSKQAADKLIAQGYQHVSDMGGIVDWNGETVEGGDPGTW